MAARLATSQLSNIDIIAVRNFNDEINDVKFLRHNKKLADHVPIQVNISMLKGLKKMEPQLNSIDKAHQYKTSIEVLNGLAVEPLRPDEIWSIF